jgi:hypothetical protein
MFWLIENKNQLTQFELRNIDKAFIEIIPLSPILHPQQNDISCIYIKPLYDYKGYIIPLNHTEVEENFDIEEIFNLIKKIKLIYCRDKKEFIHYLPLIQTVDITFDINYKPQYTNAHNYFYNKYPNSDNINSLIPITKHYEFCEGIYEDLEYQLDKPVNTFYNHTASWVFKILESSGLKVNLDLINKYFNKSYDSDIIYTRYNLKTTTTRPSNAFDGINYAALDKENGCRASIIPRNDLLVEIDISSYHPTLISQLINYNSEESIYETVSKEFNITLDEAKEVTFQQIYGGIRNNYKHLEFFNKTQILIDNIFEEFNNSGKVITPISSYCFEKSKFPDITPQKLFNYYLQNLETSNNVLLLEKIFKILKGKNTKLILYTYDSFLFDFDKNEKDILINLDNIFMEKNLNIKVKYGKNYNFK